MNRVLAASRFGLVIICILALVGVAVLAQGNSGGTWEDAIELFNQALEAYSQGSIQAAIELFERALSIAQALEEHYAEATILDNLGACYESLADYQQAIGCYKQALAVYVDTRDRPGEADCLNSLGACCEALSEYRQAINYHKRALAIFIEIGDRSGEGTALGSLGYCYYSLFDYPDAIVCFKQSLTIGQKLNDCSGVATTLGNLGNCYFARSNYTQAMHYYGQSLAIDRKTGSRTRAAKNLSNLGSCYYFLSDCACAIVYYEQALAIYLDIDDRASEASCLNNLGLCYDCLSDYQQAIDYHEQSLAICAEIDDRTGEARSLNNLGMCYYSLSGYAQAIACYEQSLQIKREIGNRSSELHSLLNLGVCYRALSDYSRTIAYHKQALALCVETGNRADEATSLYNLGADYEVLSDYQNAIEYYEQSLAIYVEIGRRSGEAASLGGLGNCHYSLSNYDQSIACYKQSLAIYVDIRDRAGEAASLNNLGRYYESMSDYQQAIEYYELSLAINRETDENAGVALNLNNLGVCYYYLSNYPQAVDCCEQALRLSVELGTRQTELLAQYTLGRTDRTLQKPEEAQTHYEAAIEIVESIRSTVGDEDLRQSYFGSERTLYEEYLELLLEIGQNDQTIYVAERLRARTFLDGLYQLGLAPEQLQLSEAGINRTPDRSLPVMDSEALEAAVSEAQGSLLPNEAVLEYMVGADVIYLWILTGEQTVGPELIPYEREQLMRDAVALRQLIEPRTEEVDDEPEFFFSDPAEALGQFYQALLQPALAQIDAAVDTLIFVPSGPLWYIPFAALVMTDQPEIQVEEAGLMPTYRPAYLVDRYTLAFLPSLASLPMLMEEETISTGSYLALANPILSEEQQTALDTDGTDYLHSALERACRTFATYVGGNETDVCVQTDAQEAVAIRSSKGQRVLMYACHGDFNPSVPLDSRLLLSPSDEEAAESSAPYLLDGDYHASEVILTDHTGVELVVLAACETLLPTLREVEGVLGLTLGPESDDELSLEQLELIVAGDEVVGLSRAFLSSGARSVLGTLWQASPSAIESLLISLGEHSQDGLSWAEALRQAQQSLMANENYDDVWFWAPYQLIGRWR